MNCPEISGLTFDQSSIAAIEEIRQKQKLGNILATLTAGSVMVKIFLGREGLANPFGIGWQLSRHDWNTWSEAVMASGPITRASIQRIALLQVEKHSGKERQFWEAILYGCGH